MRTIHPFFVVSMFLGMAGGASAMMPSLTKQPKQVTLQTCLKWASSQDEEARYLWGLMESGKTSIEVGVLRLALTCLGDSAPEIVGVGSSVGAAEAYCQKHAQQPLCKGLR